MPAIIAHDVERDICWVYDPTLDEHQVRYGLRIRLFRNTPDGRAEAAHDYGECLAHACCCDGSFDYPNPEEN